MSHFQETTPFTNEETSENTSNIISNFSSFESPYDNDSIENFALRKQLSRNIPNCYVEVNCTSKKFNHINNSNNLEEYNKLKEEIIRMKESIEVLKESKQKKLQQIEELRIQMRTSGNSQIILNNNKNKINKKENFVNSNNLKIVNFSKTREKRGNKKTGIVNGGMEDGSDCSLSLGASTCSGLSSGSGKDDETGSDEKDPRGASSDDILRNCGYCCFIQGKNDFKEMPTRKELEPIEDNDYNCLQ